MLFKNRKQNKTLNDLKYQSYGQSNKKRKQYVLSLPPSNAAVLDKIANEVTLGNKSACLKLILYQFWREHQIEFSEEV